MQYTINKTCKNVVQLFLLQFLLQECKQGCSIHLSAYTVVFCGCLRTQHSFNSPCSSGRSGLGAFCALSQSGAKMLKRVLPRSFIILHNHFWVVSIACCPKSFSLRYSPADTKSWQLPVLCFYSLTENVIGEQWFSPWVDIIFKLNAVLFSSNLLLSSYPNIIHASYFSPVHLPALSEVEYCLH